MHKIYNFNILNSNNIIIAHAYNYPSEKAAEEAWKKHSHNIQYRNNIELIDNVRFKQTNNLAVLEAVGDERLDQANPIPKIILTCEYYTEVGLSR